MPWLPEYSKRRKITIDSNKVDSDLTDFPVMISLASGTGILNQDVSDIFDELSTTNSGTIDSYTKLLLHGEGDLSDSGHTVIFNGNPQVTNAGYFDYAYVLDGNDYLYLADHVDWDWGSGSGTVECWIYPTSLPASDKCIFEFRGNGGSGWVAFINSGNRLQVFDGGYLTQSTSSVQLNTWQHVAFVKDGSTLRYFINGSSAGTASWSSASSSVGVRLGARQDTGANFTGRISEIRISKGIARWTSNFTPPTSEYTTMSGIDSYTKLLLHPGGDESASEHALTFNGNSQIIQSGKFNDAFYFDGSGDYLSISDSSDWQFGTGDFTIDFWVYYLAGSSYQGIYSYGYTSGLLLQSNNASNPQMRVFLASGSEVCTESTGAIPNNWYHYAITREGTSVKIYRDGVLTAQGTTSNSVGSGYTLTIGTGTTYYFNGYLSEFRISKGIVRWTDEFIPPTVPYPYYTDIYNYYPKRLAVTSSDGITQQYVEIEHWNPWKKEAVLWTKCPTVTSSGTDTDMYLYYGRDVDDNYKYVGDTGEIVAQRVWDDYFVGVWHLAQDPSGGSEAIKDSTSNSNHLTSGGSMTSDDLIDGKTGKAINFDGSNDYLYKAMDDLNAPITMEGVFYYDQLSQSNYDYTVMLGPDNMSIVRKNDNDFGSYSGGAWRNWSSLPGQTWCNITLIAQTTSNYLRMFFNDEEKPLSSQPASSITTNGDLTIGEYYGSHANQFDGIASEVRLSNIVRSDAWIKTTYYSNWNNLLTFSSEQSGPTVYSFGGYVKQYGDPVSRTVRLYKTDTGELMDEATSNATTGYYYLTTTYSGTHYIICLDDPAIPDFNHLVIKNAVPSDLA